MGFPIRVNACEVLTMAVSPPAAKRPIHYRPTSKHLQEVFNGVKRFELAICASIIFLRASIIRVAGVFSAK